MTTVETVTAGQIQGLLDSARNAQDMETLAVCERAMAQHRSKFSEGELSDDAEAIAECVEMLRAAEAQEG